MYKDRPPSRERVDDRTQCLQREHDGRKKPRWQMLYLLASKQAQARQDVARLLGVSRNTVGRWRVLYQAGGVVTIPDRYVPPGKRPSLAPDILASIEQSLPCPASFSSYDALRQWVAQTQHVQVT